MVVTLRGALLVFPLIGVACLTWRSAILTDSQAFLFVATVTTALTVGAVTGALLFGTARSVVFVAFAGALLPFVAAMAGSDVALTAMAALVVATVVARVTYAR